MDNKGIRSNDAYERMMQEKEDANMRYIAQIIHEEYYMPTEEELAQVEVPEELHNKMLALAREYDKKRVREMIKRRILRLGKICAVFILFIVVTGAVTGISADAVKVKLKGLLPWFEEDHVVLKPYDYTELEDWTGYYIFSEIPNGYLFKEVNEHGDIKQIIFGNDEKELSLYQYGKNTNLLIDTELQECVEISIDGERAFFFSDDANMIKKVYLTKANTILKIESYGDSSIEKKDLIVLAQKIKFVE